MAGFLSGQEIRKEGRDFVSTIEKTFNVSSGGRLVMRNVQGDVTVNSWRNNSVQIKEEIRMDVITRDEAEKILERSESSYSQNGNTIRIDSRRNRRYEQHRFYISVPQKFNLEINTSGGDITVDNLDGELDLNTSGGDIELSRIKGKIDFKTSGGDLDLRNIDAPMRGRTSGGDIDLADIKGVANVRTSGGSIRLTRAADEVIVSTSGGDIDIEDVAGDVEATTSGGSIEAIACKGKVRLRTSGGDLRLKDMAGPVSASTSGGDIDGSGFDGELEVRTSGGDIQLRAVRAAIEASTSGGNVEVEIAVTDFTKPHGVNLSTSAGDIEVFLPEKLPAKIIAEIRLGKRGWRYERYDIYSDFPISRQKLEEGRREIIRGEGEINGGGDEVRLVTSSGNIYIKKRR
jgi:DUF4097 and DUF4098 domain-containing protein YvlB